MYKVFVSYSRKDVDWVKPGERKERALMSWLRTKLEQSGIELWWDERLDQHVGQSYEELIRERIESSDTAILLLSEDFFLSRFINDFELPLIKERVESQQMQLFPIVVSHVDWNHNEYSQWIRTRHIHNSVITPLIEVVRDEAEWSKVRSRLAVALREQILPAAQKQVSMKKQSDVRPVAIDAAELPARTRSRLRPNLAWAAVLALILVAVYWIGSRIQPSAEQAMPTVVKSPHARSRFADSFTDGNGSGPDLIVLPGGTFIFGALSHDAEAQSNESPPLTRTIEPFAAAVTEVTRKQFQQFVTERQFKTLAEQEGSAGCGVYLQVGEEWSWTESKEHNWRNPGFPQDDDHPVVCVAYDDAMAYVAWLRERTGLAYRLPTEFESEYLMRAGAWSTIYPWGDELSDGCGQINLQNEVCSESDRPGNHTMSVHLLDANALGLKHTLGNVHEWTQSSYLDTPGVPGTVWTGSYVIKGGGWINPTLRPSARWAWNHNLKHSFLGFRVVRDLTQQELATVLASEPDIK